MTWKGLQKNCSGFVKKGEAWGSGQIVENSFRIRAMREDREVRH